MLYSFTKTPEYQDWFDLQPPKAKVQIEDRLSNIEEYGHFGDHHPVGAEVSELRWRNGRRIYYAVIPELNVLLLLGGNKNGQNKDINEATKIYEKHTT